MKRAIFSLIGILLIVAAISGIAISIFGIVGLWQIEADIKASVDENLALIDTTLQTTSDGLAVASQSLEQADDSLGILVATIQATGKSVEQTLPLIDTLSTVTTHDLPQTISTTQQAIQSAQVSANVIDSTLGTLASIPFLGMQGYNNAVPLSASLAELSKSLDPISASLASMGGSLAASKDNLSAIGASSAEIATNIAAIQASLGQAREVTAQYETAVKTLKQQVVTARKNVPVTLDRVSWFITIALTWLGLTQIGLMMQGLEMLGLEFKQGKRENSEAQAKSE
jgi:ABC-type transporter Mla subunit MlaD